ncbi:hypothetical protein ACFO5Q_05490 [Kordiimonas lipolytica]|uniref:Uncharacterized protein n=1 Tax=Kordiimonas lipolytica TaxID=1662421 RepID=A0ABV8U9I4_9PROT|nr:hypothetical protein [Kordiimonas lipolytica]
MRKTLKHIITAGVIAIATTATAHADDFKPEAIDFDQSLPSMRTVLSAVCSSTTERNIDPIEIPGTRRAQTQIDCTGLSFGGKLRLAEFVFRDDELALVWVLTDKVEEQAIEARMTKLFGTPSHKAGSATAFTHAHTALRKDIAEVLFYAPSVAPMFEAWFDQMVDAKNE